MRALLCRELGPFDQLTLETVPDPEPGPGQVRVAVRAAGINFPDLLIVQGKYQMRPPLPFVPGSECAGVIDAVGEGVEGLQVGDEVVATADIGAFAEKLVTEAARTVAKPAGLSFAAAAGISITYGTVYHALQHRAGLREGETLLVLGAAGGVGMAAVELGKAMGAKVIAAASSPEKLEAAAAAGADEGIDYASESLKDRVKELTGGRGANVVIDPVGGELTEQAFRAIAWEGRLLVIGFAAGEIPRLPLNLALLKGADVRGVFWGSWTQRDPAAYQESLEELRRLFEAERLRPSFVTYPLARFQEALGSLAERRAVGKVVLSMSEGDEA